MMWTITGSLFAFTPRPEGKHFPRTAGLLYPFGGLGNLVFNEMTGAIYDHQSSGPSHTCKWHGVPMFSPLVWLNQPPPLPSPPAYLTLNPVLFVASCWCLATGS